MLCAWLLGLAAFTAAVLVMTPHKPNQTTDAIVVLTGGKDRIEAGLALFADGKAPELFITGVNAHVTMEEIKARHQGNMPDCCITLGYQARSTIQNAKETQQWLADKNIKSIRLVTSNYHIPRALLEFHTMLPGIEILPNPIMQPDITPEDEYFWRLIVIEYHKTMFRFLDLLFKGIT